MAEQVAWAAGLFEGEGSAHISGTQRQPRLQLAMTDEDVVRRFASIVQCGTVRNYHKPAGRRPVWHWSVGGAADVLKVLGAFWPYLGERRQERAMEVIERAVKIGEPQNGGGRKSTGLCKRGHDLTDPTHLYVHAKTGKRHCRTCRSAYARQRKQRRVV